MFASFWHSKSISAIVERCSASGSSVGGGSGMNTPGELGHGGIGGELEWREGRRGEGCCSLVFFMTMEPRVGVYSFNGKVRGI